MGLWRREGGREGGPRGKPLTVERLSDKTRVGNTLEPALPTAQRKGSGRQAKVWGWGIVEVGRGSGRIPRIKKTA